MQTTHKFGGCPWKQANYNYGDGIIGLHEEIEHFYRYILPTPTEHAVRIEVVKRIESIIHELWPQALVEILGSFRTGLFLPNSDIDLVVLGRWEKLPLRSLELELLRRDIVKAGTMRVVDTAVVPIIKFTDSKTQIKLDVSFNMSDGIQSAEMIKQFSRDYPGLGKLVLVLKQFMLQRKLSEAFSGGISSYSLILMCISFLQLHPRDNFHAQANLGVLLLEFFELYGIRFNYAQIGISIRHGGCYNRKENTFIGSKQSALSIDDSLQNGSDVARSSFAIVSVKQAFQWAYRVLSQAVYPQGECQLRHNAASSSILGCIIQITDELVDYRAWLHENFDHLVVVESISPLYGQINGAAAYVTLASGAVEQRIYQTQPQSVPAFHHLSNICPRHESSSSSTEEPTTAVIVVSSDEMDVCS
ncbi:non-canonical poly(A) RNA polymerase protein Trf4-1-like [Drosophila montana]|uniref:non-canonical poly(A) RNA polymerase protein Trf4-1-like n=1 Tax=Drosophila montana TaxID=40370 RepID=UPI00313BE19B